MSFLHRLEKGGVKSLTCLAMISISAVSAFNLVSNFFFVFASSPPVPTAATELSPALASTSTSELAEEDEGGKTTSVA